MKLTNNIYLTTLVSVTVTFACLITSNVAAQEETKINASTNLNPNNSVMDKKSGHAHPQTGHEKHRYELTHEGVSLLLIELLGMIVVPVLTIPLLIFALYYLANNAGRHGGGGGGSHGGGWVQGGSHHGGTHYYGGSHGSVGHGSTEYQAPSQQEYDHGHAYKKLDKDAEIVDQVNNLTAKVLPHL